jgi:antitoxin HigA-1
MDTLMRMQNSFDIARTRKRSGDIKVNRYEGPDTEDAKSAGV